MRNPTAKIVLAAIVHLKLHCRHHNAAISMNPTPNISSPNASVRYR